MKRWHVYEDWTTELIPRCFYVGKGDDDRVIKFKRGKYHTEIAQCFGQQRVIVQIGFDELAILDVEKNVIAERHTYIKDPDYNGVGCNRTRGGQGNSGRVVSKETCKKISVAKRGKTPNKVWSQKEREATSARMSLLHKGKHLSEKHISILQSRMADPIIKQNMIDKVTESIRTKYEDTTFRQHIIDTRARGEASHSKFTNDEIRQIRSEWEHVDKSIKGGRWKGISPTWQFCQKWADFKGVSSKAIYGIVMRRTWRFLDVLTDS